MYQLSIDDYLEETRAIPLFHCGRDKDVYTFVSACDFDLLMQWHWYYQSPGYAMRKPIVDGESTQVWMHRVIMDCPDGFVVDHINGDGLWNVRSNLRICTQSQNCRNSKKRQISSSKYKGVTQHTGAVNWQACIFVDNKNLYLGSFDLEVDAALAYDEAARKYYGEFARLNLPNGTNQIPE